MGTERSPAGLDTAAARAWLVELIAEHERLLVVLAEHRRAIARADAKAMGVWIARENEIVARLRELNERRRGLITGLPRLQRSATLPTLSQLLESVPEAERGDLSALIERARERMTAASREQAVVRASSEAMLSHMSGMLARLEASRSHAGTYSRAARVESRATVVSGLDVRG